MTITILTMWPKFSHLTIICLFRECRRFFFENLTWLLGKSSIRSIRWRFFEHSVTRSDRYTCMLKDLNGLWPHHLLPVFHFLLFAHKYAPSVWLWSTKFNVYISHVGFLRYEFYFNEAILQIHRNQRCLSRIRSRVIYTALKSNLLVTNTNASRTSMWRSE